MFFSDPKYNIEQFALSSGMQVADIGVGSGFYTIEAAKVVGEDGKIYAVDIQKDLLSRVKNMVNQNKLYNVEIIWGDAEQIGGTKLRDLSVEAVIVTNILFQIEDKENFCREIYRILRPNGRVLFVDWTDSFGNTGPRSQDVIVQEVAEKLFSNNGFEKEKDISAGAHHYGFILKKV